MGLNHLLFAVMSLIWGATWIAIAAGVSVVPPVTFAAARYLLVAAVLLAVVPGARRLLADPGQRGRVMLTGLLVNAATYGLLYWGMQRVPSGVSGLVNLSMIAVSLFGLAILLGDERPSWHHVGALALGIAGLMVLFWGDLAGEAAGPESQELLLLSLGAIVLGTLAYCLGSVLSRPLLLGGATPLELTGAQAAVGAVGLALVALVVEHPGWETLDALLAPAPLAGLLFLVVFGTFMAYTIYLRLVREWGAPRAGLYAFVSPVVALVLGAVVLGEPLGLREAGGAVLMLAAAAVAVQPRPEADNKAQIS